MSLGTGILPDVSLGNIDLLENSWFTLREFGSKAQNLLSLIGASASSTCARSSHDYMYSQLHFVYTVNLG